MTLSSLDGLLPSVFKKLLAGELPELQSSYISEAMAAGAGYRNNAAYLNDLKGAGPISFVSVAKIDSNAMEERLLRIGAARDIDVAPRLQQALERITNHVRGDIVPLGPNSSIAASPRHRSIVASDDRAGFRNSLIEMLDGPIPQRIYPTTSLMDTYIRTLVAACRSVAPDGVVNSYDLATATRLENVMTLADPYAFPSMPKGIRKAVRDYLMSLPSYDIGQIVPTKELIAQHALSSDVLRRAVEEERQARGEEFDRDTKSIFASAPFFTDRQRALSVYLQHGLDTHQAQPGEERHMERARFLASILVALVGGIEGKKPLDRDTLQDAIQMHALVKQMDSGESGGLALAIQTYIRSLPAHDGPGLPSLDAVHSPVKWIVDRVIDKRHWLLSDF